MNKLDWLTRKDEEGISIAMVLVLFTVVFLLAGIAGGIETGGIWP